MQLIEVGAFEGLVGLKILDLSHNLITVPTTHITSAPQSIYQPLMWLDELQYLDLSFNRINLSGVETSNTDLLLPSLIDLNLDVNPITVLNADAFAPFRNSSLSRLRLEDTNLTRIERGDGFVTKNI